MIKKVLKPDSGEFQPDAYDSDGYRTIDSWELYNQDELASEDDD